MEEKIISFCNIPKTREQIAQFCGFTNPSYMIKVYVMPLVEQEKLTMTVPDKSKSKKQKYKAV